MDRDKIYRWFLTYKQSFLIKIDDFFGNPIIYDYQKTFLKLTFLVACAVFVIAIEQSVSFNTDKSLFRFLLSSNIFDKDGILYNICTSIVAAYIFYIFQVFIPEKNRCTRNCSKFSYELRYVIFLLNQYVLAWNEFLGQKPDECHFFNFCYKTNVFGSNELNEKTYGETINVLPETLKKIIESRFFAECDISYQDFIISSYYVIYGHLKFMDDRFPRWSNYALIVKDDTIIQEDVLGDMKRIQLRMCAIEKLKLVVTSVESCVEKKQLE